MPHRAALTRLVAALPATVPFVAPEELVRRGGRVRLRLGANESLFGPSPRVVEALRAAAPEACLYGDPEGFALRQALAEMLGCAAGNLVLGCGIDELHGLFVRAYLESGEAAVMSAGAYPTFAYHIAGHGGRIVTAPYRDFENDPEALLDAAREAAAKLLYLANPDNPTGSILPAATVEAMIARLPDNCLLVLDEAYADLAPPGGLPRIDDDDPRVVRFRTFSKVHGLAGMRVGYAFGAPEMVRPIDRVRNHFAVGRLSQVAALAALADQDHVATVAAAIADGRRDYAAIAEAAGFRTLLSATNFVAFDIATRERADRLLALLLADGVFVRKPMVPPLDRLVRISTAPEGERRDFAESFARAAALL